MKIHTVSANITDNAPGFITKPQPMFYYLNAFNVGHDVLRQWCTDLDAVERTANSKAGVNEIKLRTMTPDCSHCSL